MIKKYAKKIFFFAFTLSAFVQSADAQNSSLIKFTPAAPSATGVSKFGDIPVNLHTGIASVNIPLLNLSISGFNLPIDISYHGGGIKTEDVASNVGLGWALNAGGQLNKIVVKYPDEGFFASVADTVTIIKDGFDNILRKNPANGTNWKYDNDEPDLFRVTAPGLNCKFSKLIVHSPKEKIQVQRLPDASFILTNTEGIKYSYGGKISTLKNNKAIEDSTTYYLTQIELINGQKVNFEYDAVDISLIKSSGKEIHYLSKTNGIQDLIDDGLSSTWNHENKTRVYRISNIIFPGGKLQFLYESARKDLPGASTLTGIRQFESSGITFLRKVKDIHFHQSYFESGSFEVRANPDVDAKYKSLFYRLRLDSLSINGLSHPDTYSFNYNNIEMPEQGSLSQDHWGYYNGSPNQSLVPPYTRLRDAGTFLEHTIGSSFSDRQCSDSLSQAGILKKIVYPNGGSTSFEYELNTTETPFPGYESYPDPLTRKTSFGRKSMPIPPSLGTPEQGLFCGTNFVINSPASVNGVKGQDIVFNFTRGAANQNTFIQVILRPLAAGNASIRTLSLDTIINIPAGTINPLAFFNRFMPNGVYRIEAAKVSMPDYNGTSTDVIAPVDLSFSVGGVLGRHYASIIPNQYPAGGLRIKNMSTFDGIDPTKDIIQSYKYNKFSNPSVSSGSFGVLPEYKEQDMSLYVPTSTFAAAVGTKIEYYTFPEVFWNIQVFQNAGDTVPRQRANLNVQFVTREVESIQFSTALKYTSGDFKVVMANSNKTAIKPLESYVGYSNVTIEYGENASGGKKELAYSNTGKDWQRGLLTKEKIYKKNSSFIPSTEKTSNYVIDNDWYYLQNDSLKEYSSTDTTQSTLTRSFYNYAIPFLNIPSKTVSVNSTGDSTITETKVVAAFSNITQSDDLSLGIKRLYDKNMITAPIEQMSYRKSATGRGNLISTFTEYFNNIPYPRTVYSSEVVSAGTAFSSAVVSNGAISKSSLYKPLLDFSKYDDAGNLLEQQKQNGVPNSFIWGYNKQHLVAEVTNAKSGQIYYNSFEEGDGSYDANAKAGNLSHTGNYTVAFTPSPSIPLKITYWVWNNDSWTFQSSAYTPGMILSGTKIDEIRIYPENSQMATYTYKPGTGLLSKCDAKNQYQYYEYNAEGKTIAIKNNNKELVQTIQYQPKVVAIH
ncbi:Flagellar hook protein FlgE [Pedobacter steynii]|uniref:Flagellar hook protein FlgE n=1 Tax=Pedobacter steynii TaxID=430522 RepID=A0A1H0L7Z2_9SPHI|nr:hypothetical protein [Pedobacter steynii]NQX43440.1 hypothetical protein [Pedobacter steynii]SDO64338.1 Flagellar hook protein FlgE [Pedobacter steynii]